ncbi:hypothetical protein FRC09_012569 [Ceratobasidium sp. 395]|nr:hypothetical protein FRC09_012569 [Ceratobasidium sp. 395]
MPLICYTPETCAGYTKPGGTAGALANRPIRAMWGAGTWVEHEARQLVLPEPKKMLGFRQTAIASVLARMPGGEWDKRNQK